MARKERKMKLTDEEVRKIRVALNARKNYYLLQSINNKHDRISTTLALQYATLEEKFSGADIEIVGE